MSNTPMVSPVPLGPLAGQAWGVPESVMLAARVAAMTQATVWRIFPNLPTIGQALIECEFGSLAVTPSRPRNPYGLKVEIRTKGALSPQEYLVLLDGLTMIGTTQKARS
jgi:hypothetical protein